MNMITHKAIRYMLLRVLLVIFINTVFILPLPASASLGGDETTIYADQAHMQGTLQKAPGGDKITVQTNQILPKSALQATPTNTYTVHEIKTPTGTTVREYLSPADKVFAVVWQGPFLPNLRQLFGLHFKHFSQAVENHKNRHSRVRGPLLIQEPDLVVQTGGHMRAYFGRAYLPELIPQGVDIKEIR